MQQGEIVWTPSVQAWEVSPVGRYLEFLRTIRGQDFTTYSELHAWSVADLSAFWTSVWDFYGVESHSPFEPGLADPSMPGAVWFPGSSVNYAAHALQPDRDGVAIVERSQTRRRRVTTWPDLRAEVAAVRTALDRAGVRAGDVVAAYSPVITETVVAYLACASLGAIFTSCAAEFGVEAVLSRLQQVQPRVLFAADGYRYGTREIDRRPELAQIVRSIPSLETMVLVPFLYPEPPATEGVTSWDGFKTVDAEPLEFTPVPFDHPLVVVYSSGTTGAPKAIVHSHGGVLLEHLKSLGIQLGLDATSRFFWYTTTGWMMWNYLISGLLVGSSIVLFEGDPGYPDAATLWRVAAEEEITVFGVSPRFLQATRRTAGRALLELDLQRVKAVGSTGSPLGLDEYAWFYRETGLDVPLVSASGGTDVLSGLVCWCPIVPIFAGEISCPALGVDVEVVDPAGRTLVDEQGELVVRQPMPSMPVGLWRDLDGTRLRQTYFAANSGVWTQGDWATMTHRQTFVLTGRSDATLNRRGVRIGTAELYAVVEEMPDVYDSVAVCLEATDAHDDVLLLFVVLPSAAYVDTELERRVKTAIRQKLSPRHVPDKVLALPEVPRNAAGKKLELAVKYILQGRYAAKETGDSSTVSPAVIAHLKGLAAGFASNDAGG